ncbi:MAG: glutamine--fructose-6-phosphate transaminase (isomerizing) [Candidatus Chisholmbacteria bacterium RIFCSPLOWO2_01_FULL_50_28]|uniref:Glutamine--fructose-6-phosphate aminotransferase [isomerizing] n=1 Tax=Candidatus Chisholmbacteria bacterium RIFCSPHIGHO2_01_FULL_52_32 TaxID=1797591 RepID=A0A1G1VSS2_9BACT|nr:MAG: glutamine--fructose-6-phosphate transaminase (isomerizing) [Candidatus Chisholmbacteria bacterium RIFCSPHIGHO2_01_FULL_52_32]OGY20183.1 MAG: glutamine--fructose-6-phosphate transaminase (isomerizing) [Candidatus Chisholmbacteria bacterium RIFCSPLOWO2_01_FULL_50_28]
MCGIFAYVGKSDNAAAIVFEGLKRLDYRGYDSWGVGILKNESLRVEKRVGVVDRASVKLPRSSIAIGHTRWATNGAVTAANAHPHYASDRSFILAHNGIAENFAIRKEELIKKRYRFVSETDTEVIVRQIEEERKRTPTLAEAVRSAFKTFTGRNTIILLSRDGQMIAARNGSPLVVGVNDNFSEIYLSSDTLSFAPRVSQIIVLDNGQMVTVFDNKVSTFDIKTGRKVRYLLEKNTILDSSVDKKGHKHFMIKEIYEEPLVINRIIEQPSSIYRNFAKAITKAAHVYCIGSGTAGKAAAQIAYYLRTLGKIPAVSLIGAEAQDYISLIGKNDLLIAPSQSGETADVLEVMEAVKKKGTKIASFVNMPGSMMTRLSDYKFMAEAGPEICVMSTKIFVSQLAWGYCMAKAASEKLDEGKSALRILSDRIDRFLHSEEKIAQIKRLAKALAAKHDIFLLGKGQNLQIVNEGMVKMIEGSYLHAHAIPAGDLKHYAITLMEPGVPVIFVISNDTVKTDVLNALHEVKARGAHIIAIAPRREKSFDEYIEVPDLGDVSAMMNIVPLQVLAYYMAVVLGHNVDKPRNIAKSVTVK